MDGGECRMQMRKIAGVHDQMSDDEMVVDDGNDVCSLSCVSHHEQKPPSASTPNFFPFAVT